MNPSVRALDPPLRCPSVTAPLTVYRRAWRLVGAHMAGVAARTHTRRRDKKPVHDVLANPT